MNKVFLILGLLVASSSLMAEPHSGKVLINKDFSFLDFGYPTREGVFYRGRYIAANDFDGRSQLPVGESYCIVTVGGSIPEGSAKEFYRGDEFSYVRSSHRTIDLIAENLTFISCYANTARGTVQALTLSPELLQKAFGDYLTID